MEDTDNLTRAYAYFNMAMDLTNDNMTEIQFNIYMDLFWEWFCQDLEMES